MGKYCLKLKSFFSCELSDLRLCRWKYRSCSVVADHKNKRTGTEETVGIPPCFWIHIGVYSRLCSLFVNFDESFMEYVINPKSSFLLVFLPFLCICFYNWILLSCIHVLHEYISWVLFKISKHILIYSLTSEIYIGIQLYAWHFCYYINYIYQMCVWYHISYYKHMCVLKHQIIYFKYVQIIVCNYTSMKLLK